MDAIKLHSDQKGSFQVTPRRGVKYLFILYSYNVNRILSKPLKNRTRKETIQEYTTCHDYLKEKGFKPKIHWLDNEASNAPKKYNQNQGGCVYIVPPEVDRSNSSEIAIQT